MMRQTRSRIGSSFTEIENLSLGNGEIGLPYKKVKSRASIKPNSKKEERHIESPNAISKCFPKIQNNIKIVSTINLNSNNSSSSECYGNEFEQSKNLELEDPVLIETKKQSKRIVDGKHFARNGIQHSSYGSIEEKRTNTFISELKTELCLSLYCFFSLLYFSMIASMGRRPSFSSMQEALFCKIIWCMIFGCIVDLFSWKTAFRIQSLLWLILLLSNFLESSFISSILSMVCVSSSASLVTEIAIFKLYKREKCWLPICRLSIMNSLCLLFVQFCSKDILRISLSEYFQKDMFKSLSFDFFNYSTSLTVVDLPSVMNIGCTVSLLIAAYLGNEKSKHSNGTAITDSDEVRKDYSSKNKKFNSYVKILMLKISIFLPAICFSAIFNSYLEVWRAAVMPVHIVAFCFLSMIGQYLSVARILAMLCLLMISSFVLHLHHYLYIWASISASTSSLLFSVIVCLIRPCFQYVAKLEVNENIAGFSLSSAISLHFLMKYFAPTFINAVKYNNEFLNSFKLF